MNKEHTHVNGNSGMTQKEMLFILIEGQRIYMKELMHFTKK